MRSQHTTASTRQAALPKGSAPPTALPRQGRRHITRAARHAKTAVLSIGLVLMVGCSAEPEAHNNQPAPQAPQAPQAGHLDRPLDAKGAGGQRAKPDDGQRVRKQPRRSGMPARAKRTLETMREVSARLGQPNADHEHALRPGMPPDPLEHRYRYRFVPAHHTPDPPEYRFKHNKGQTIAPAAAQPPTSGSTTP